MEDHHNKPNEPKHLGIEMDVLEDKNCSPRQVGLFPGIARRLSTNSQRPNGEIKGHQVVGNIPAIQDKVKEARRDTDITSGTYDLYINRSPVTCASGQCISKNESNRLFYRDISETRVGVEDTHDNEATTDGGYFLAMHDLHFRRRSERDAKQLNSVSGESTQVFHREVLDTQVESERNKHDDKTKRDESYFLANYELQFEQDARLRSTKSDPIQLLVHSSKLKPNCGAKRHQVTHGKSNVVDGEYWRRILIKDGVTPDDSSLEQMVSEAKHQWYRSRRMRPEYFRSRTSTNLEFWFIILALIMIIIFTVLILLLWKYLLSISS